MGESKFNAREVIKYKEENEALRLRLASAEQRSEELWSKLQLEETTREAVEHRANLLQEERVPQEIRVRRLQEEVNTLQKLLVEARAEGIAGPKLELARVQAELAAA